MGLLKNELIKIFGKKLTYFVLIGVILISVLYAAGDRLITSRYFIEDYPAHLQQEYEYDMNQLETDELSYTTRAWFESEVAEIELKIEVGIDSSDDWRNGNFQKISDLYYEKKTYTSIY